MIYPKLQVFFVYIGKTWRFRSRAALHRSALRGGRHCNINLQCDWHQFGEEYFSFRALEELGYHDFSWHGKEREYHYMAVYFDRLYNVSYPLTVPTLAAQLRSR